MSSRRRDPRSLYTKLSVAGKALRVTLLSGRRPTTTRCERCGCVIVVEQREAHVRERCPGAPMG